MKTRQFLTPRVLCAAFVFALFLLTPATSNAQSPYGSTGAFLYTVQYGDTLSAIAARFGVSAQSIMQANRSTTPYLSVGQSMYLPQGYAPSAYANTATYRVQPGETLYGIAQRYGVSMYTLMNANHIYNPNYLYAGRSLRMPYERSTPQNYQTYIIRFGDTLSGLAVRFGTSIYALMIANNIPDPNLIFAGMRLVVPTMPIYSSSPQYPANRYATPIPATPGPTMIPAIGAVNVALKNTAFNPQTLAIKVGTTVIWQNTETNGMVHTVTSGTPNAPNGMFDSGMLNPGQSFQFTFNTPGTFAYYCRIHGAMMTGSVTITP